MDDKMMMMPFQGAKVWRGTGWDGQNSVERFVGKDDESFEDVIDTSHNAPGNPWDNARL